MKAIVSILVAIFVSTSVQAEELCPKYGACVSADQFDCHDIDRSSVVKRVCYNEANAYMIIRLKSTDYHYCGVDAATVEEFLAASSMGRFYNQNIKVDANGGRFDCRTHTVPTF